MGGIVIEHGHGHGMGAGEHWYEATGEEFAAEGHEVRIPNFPEPFAPDADGWLRELEELDMETAGAPAGEALPRLWLRLLQGRGTGAEGAFSGVAPLASGEVGSGALAPIFSPEFDWQRNRRAARELRVLRAAGAPVSGEPVGEHVVRCVRGLGAGARVTASGGPVPSTGGSRLVLPDAVRLIGEVL
ncbi:hypothetical protein [Streptomyces sp. NBC_01264]|uniref:hypothetical protein n=1 Tax=Streptomyces sp. NBC_01264 TaxID=2903804 RepID=UPI00225BC212|nr:hypothetical protein [Streptomyces sp. NBC_01264]MCX4777671.1 hypothetical protein [Streptomyces sp. NBC_01264]